MPAPYSDETLMAFADGQLDEPHFSEVAAAVETNEALAHRLEAIVSGGALARAGFDALLEPVSPRLEAGVKAAMARSQRKGRIASLPSVDWARAFSWARPLGFGLGGAALAALMLVAGTFSSGPVDTPDPLVALAGPGISEALDTLPSGGTSPLPSGETLSLIATFRDADDRVCREFETGTHLGLACRDGDRWALDVAIAQSSDPASYRPASGTSVLDAHLDAIGAGQPLLDGEESAALARP